MHYYCEYLWGEAMLLFRILASAAVLALAAPASVLAIEVGDVFWLSSKGIGRTVMATAQAQPGVVRVDYKILYENVSEYCQRSELLKRGTAEHDKCVAETVNEAKLETALVNCRTKVLVLGHGSFAKGADHFWRSKADPNSFVLGDELFQKSCQSAASAPQRTSPPSAQAPGTTDNSIKNLVTFVGRCRFQIVSGFFDCDPKAVYAQLRNNRSMVVFKSGDTSFTLSGGRDRQPNLDNYYIGIDRFKMERSGSSPSEDNGMEGECHFKLNNDATKFYSVKCDIYNRSRGTTYNFYLENISSFERKAY